MRNKGVEGGGVGFGYSSVDGNHTGILGVQNNAVSITGWSNGNVTEYDTNGAADGRATAVPGNKPVAYRVYALAWTVDLNNMPPGFSHTQHDLWVSNGDNWSNNPADWTQIITDLHPRSTAENNVAMPAGAYPGDPAPPYGQESDIMLGSFSPGFAGFGRTAAGDLDFDWLTMVTNGFPSPGYGFTITPWSVDYSQVPEPASLVALVSLAGLALRRRRASVAPPNRSSIVPLNRTAARAEARGFAVSVDLIRRELIRISSFILHWG